MDDFTERQLPNLTPTTYGSHVYNTPNYQVEAMLPGRIDLNIGDGEALGFDPGEAEQVALGLLAAVRHVRAQKEGEPGGSV